MFPIDPPSAENSQYVNPDEVALAIADLGPFSKDETKLIAREMTDQHYVGMDEEMFENKLPGRNEVRLDLEGLKKLQKYLHNCLNKGKTEVFLSVRSASYDEDNDDDGISGATRLMVFTKSDKKKLNKSIVQKIRHLITENREYAAKRQNEKDQREAKTAQMSE